VPASGPQSAAHPVDTVLRFLPPYIVTEKDVDAAMKVRGKIFAKQKASQ
jgi:hypothetical protein